MDPSGCLRNHTGELTIHEWLEALSRVKVVLVGRSLLTRKVVAAKESHLAGN